MRHIITTADNETITFWTTTADYEDEVVIPSLGDYADEFNTGAIAGEMLTWRDHYNAFGEIVRDRSGFAERDDVDFWDIAAKHDTAQAA